MRDPIPPTAALARPAPALPQHSPPAVDISSGVFSGIAAFEAAQRMAQALCTSTMVPSEYRGQQGLSNSLIALEIAARMGLSPLVVMQNMTPIHGKPTWSSSFLIATVNASGRFTPLRFVFDDKDQPSRCYAVASDKSSGEVLEGETISVEMAKREGWWSRPDRYGKETSKWQSMTGQMLRYRAAAFWVKVYCPEISLGLMTQDEAADVQPVVVDAIEAQGDGQPRAQPAAAVPELLPPRPLQQAASQTAVSPPAAAALSTTDSDEKTQATTTEAPAPAPPAARRSSRRTAAAQKGADASAATDSDGTTATAPGLDVPPAAPTQEPTATAKQLAANELPAIETAAPQAVAATQAELLSDTTPAAADAAQGGGASSSDLVSTGQREIPKLNSVEALEHTRQRVNRLLAEGQLNDEGAERLWSLIDRRLQQLQSQAGEGEP
jgi:hypothetical protein